MIILRILAEFNSNLGANITRRQQQMAGSIFPSIPIHRQLKYQANLHVFGSHPVMRWLKGHPLVFRACVCLCV